MHYRPCRQAMADSGLELASSGGGRVVCDLGGGRVDRELGHNDSCRDVPDGHTIGTARRADARVLLIHSAVLSQDAACDTFDTNMVGAMTNIIGTSSSFANVFATPTLAALLIIFAEHPERHFMQKELVEQSGSALYLVQRELKRLERTGLISREPRGRQVEYYANIEHPGFAGLRYAILNTLGLGSRLRSVFEGVEGISLAFIFGSVADGTERSGSDLDLLVVGEFGLRAVSEKVMPLLRDLGREPNIAVMTEAELRDRASTKDNFVEDIIKGPKVWLVGDDEQLTTILG